jgi:hypothetical protein
MNWTGYVCASLYIGHLKKDINLFDVIEKRAILSDDLIDVPQFAHHYFFVKQQRQIRGIKYGIIVSLSFIINTATFFRDFHHTSLDSYIAIYYKNFSDYLPNILIFIATFLAVWILTLIDIRKNYRMAKSLIENGISDLPKIKPKYQKDVDEIKKWICKNIICYSGYSPFVGVGFKIGGWDFALDIDKPKTTAESRPILGFETVEIYIEIKDKIKRLNLPKLQVENKIIIAGNKVRDNTMFFDGSNIKKKFDTESVTQFASNKMSEGRFYTNIFIDSEDDSGRFNTYLRFFKNDSILHTEVAFFALPLRIKDYKLYKNWKIFELNDGNRIIESFVKAVINFILGMFFIFKLLTKLDGIFTRHIKEENAEKNIEKSIEENPSYDFGAKEHINQIITGSFDDFCRDQDFFMHMKIIEKRILNTIEEFLASKGIDTKDFRERETNILNNGIIISGSKLNAQNLAIGDKAKIKTEKK